MKLSECPICIKKRKLETHRRLTQYADDTKNWIKCCKECFVEDNDHYNAMWAEYWSGAL